MLRIEATGTTKAILLIAAIAEMVCGIPLALVGFAELIDAETTGGALFLAQAAVASGCLLAIIATRSLLENWYFGTIHTRLIANSRTLAIVPNGARATFVKQRDCVGIGLGGRLLVLSDGSEQSLQLVNVGYDRLEREFIAPLMDLWWPGVGYEKIHRFFDRSGRPAIAWRWLLLGGFLTPLALATASTFRDQLGNLFWLEGITIAFLIYAYIVCFPVRHAYNRERRRIYRIDVSHGHGEACALEEDRHAAD